MNRIRVASLAVLIALAFAPLPAAAQGPPSNPGPGSGLQAQVEALAARVDKLESGQITAADLVGTYAGIVLQLELLAPALGGAGVQHQTAAVTFTFNEDLSAVISGRDALCRLFPIPPANLEGWRVICPIPEDFSDVQGNWFLDVDGSLVVQVGGEDVINDPNFIGAGGRVIISAGTGGSTGGAGQSNASGHSVFMVLTRMPNP